MNAFLEFLSRLFSAIIPGKFKENYEYMYWKYRKMSRGTFANDHFEEAFTSFYGIEKEFYRNKKLLDIGCGPAGSLEWASDAALRIGVDPLADKYQSLGLDHLEMKMLKAHAEKLPFEDHCFDVISSMNSLDHVDDLDQTLGEIDRVLKPGGLFLLITDVGHKPTPFEPQQIDWNVLDGLKPGFEIEVEKHFERSDPARIYQSIRNNIAFNHKRSRKRYGVLLVKARKKIRV